MRRPDSLSPPQGELLVGQTEDSFNINEYVQLVLSRWQLIAVVVALSVGAGLAHFLITPKQYRAKTMLQVQMRSWLTIAAQNPWLEAFASMKYFPTQYKLLESRGLAERVVLNLHLMDDPTLNPNRSQLLPDAQTNEAVTAAADEAELARMARRLQGGLTVEPIRDTELVTLSYVSQDPNLASRIVNGFADAFIEWEIEQRSTSVGKASTFLTSQIETLKLEILEKEDQLQQYGRTTDIVTLDPSTNATLQRLAKLNQDSTSALGERLEKEARKNELLAAPKDKVADRESGGLVAELQRALEKQQRQYETKLTVYKPEWPEMVELSSSIEQLRQHLGRVIDENFQKALRAADAEYRAALRRETALRGEIDKVKEEALDLNSAAVEFKNLEMEISNRRDLLDLLISRLSETGVSARLQSTRESNVRVVDRALVPRGPFRPSLRNDLTGGLGAGFAIGIGLVLLLHFLDRTVKTPDALERLLGLPILAIIPDISSKGGYGPDSSYSYIGKPRSGSGLATLPLKEGRKGGQKDTPIELIPETNPRLAISEAYRGLRTALLLSSADRLQVVAVTSSVASEGKTATALNLAVVMAQLDRRVLLVDCDLRKPRIHKLLDVSNRVGLVNYLTGGAELEPILLPTSVVNLTVSPSGPQPPNPSELLASERMAEFLTAVRARYDFVVIDTPPVLAVTDAIMPGKLADGMVLCCQAGRIPREDARSCYSRLRMSDVRILGAVLNRFRPQRSGYYGGKYRYYSDEHYYQAYSDSSENPAVDSAA